MLVELDPSGTKIRKLNIDKEKFGKTSQPN